MSTFYDEPDFRYNTLVGNATREFHAMSTYGEKVGAHRMVSLLSSHLSNAQKKKEHMTVKSIVSTIQVIEKNLFQDILLMSPTLSPQSLQADQAGQLHQVPQSPPLLLLNQSAS